jgi:pyridoxal phosphate enzyme (YggS family)
MDIEERLNEVLASLPEGVELVAVSKFHPADMIREAYDCGQRIFGESHVQELQAKRATLPDDIQWHFIGHLQRNKVKQILPYVSCIQSLDSLRLAETIEKEAAALGRTVSCLLEFHLAAQDTRKTGLLPEEADAMMQACQNLPHLSIDGIMAMGPHTDDADAVRAVFREGRGLYDRLRAEYPSIHILSMGMSDDYLLALEAGSNMVRIGSKLFQED